MAEDTIRRSGLTEVEVRTVPLEEFPKCCAICENMYYDPLEDNIIFCDNLPDFMSGVNLTEVCDMFELTKVRT